MDAAGHIRLANRAFETRLGYSSAEALGRRADFLLADSAAAPGLFDATAQAAVPGVSATVEALFRGRDGREFWADADLSAWRPPAAARPACWPCCATSRARREAEERVRARARSSPRSSSMRRTASRCSTRG
ncbi:MAG: PAS domain S-box protein [Comamonadaceae bacterium]|nr:PAS domain S-box protein [Comamonadaceae bacterium]